MKKLLLIVILSASFGKMFAQNEYFQFNPRWSVLDYGTWQWPCVYIDSTVYYTDGDTIINSLQYKKLYRVFNGHYFWDSWQPNSWCTGQNVPDTLYYGCLRSQGMQIYYVMQSSTGESLLYDYNLSIGDSVATTMFFVSPGQVTSIDSIYTAAGYRNRYFIENSTTDFLLEGIGSSFGLLEPFGLSLNGTYSLICYEQNDTSWFPGQGPACDILLSTQLRSQPDITVNISPNPATESISIITNSSRIESCTVYDVFGRVVKTDQLSSSIFVGDLPPGIYTCIVVTGETRISKLLIVE